MIENAMSALSENSSANGQTPYDLIDRLGETHFRQRMTIEQDHADDIFGRGRTRFHIQNAEWVLDLLDAGLSLTGLQARGLENVLDIQTVHEEWQISALPAAFAGYRILQISDLHIDIAPGLTEAVIAAIKPLEYDLCVITGDYRWQTSGPDRAAQREMRSLFPTFAARATRFWATMTSLALCRQWRPLACPSCSMKPYLCGAAVRQSTSAASMTRIFMKRTICRRRETQFRTDQ